MKRFLITLDGVSMEELSDNIEVTDKFSGEITYQVEYELPDEPKTSDRYKIVLEDTVSSARISIDGELVATVGMTPMETIVSGEKFNKQGIIEITVANTAANEIISKKHLIEKHSSMTIGPYHWHERSLQFEKNAPKIRFGKLKLHKMK